MWGHLGATGRTAGHGFSIRYRTCMRRRTHIERTLQHRCCLGTNQNNCQDSFSQGSEIERNGKHPLCQVACLTPTYTKRCLYMDRGLDRLKALLGPPHMPHDACHFSLPRGSRFLDCEIVGSEFGLVILGQEGNLEPNFQIKFSHIVLKPPHSKLGW
jgi:hypothetical protein